MERYTVVPLRSCSFGENGCYGVRIGGQGGHIVGDGMRLDSYQADRLRELLSHEFLAGQQSQVEA